jgi:hypothetical protein
LGQRHFIAADPIGTLIDFVTAINPDTHWLEVNGG